MATRMKSFAPTGATLRERFLFHAHVEHASEFVDTACWRYQGGSRDDDGYVQMNVGGGKMRRVHRVGYELFRGRIPEGLELDHICEVKDCANPWHLRPVTPSENKRAWMDRRGVCRNGHDITRA
jgi:hypothetical protein